MNQLKALTPARLKIALLGFPLALALLYYTLFAADRYVSETTVALRQATSESSALPGTAMLLAGITPPSREDTLYLKEYVHSLGLLKLLDQKLQVRQHYEAVKRDPLFRLWSGASQETFLDYYRARVEVTFDDLSSLLTIRVQGFDPSFAQTLNKTILQESERFVNEFSHKIAREKLSFADAELLRAGQRLQEARAQVLAFQGKHKLLDPLAQAQASGALTAEMQASVARAEAELRNLRTFLNDDAYQVKALQSQIRSTRAQLEDDRARATGSSKQGDRLGALAIEFQGLQLQAEFAMDAYKVALGAVENARIDTTRKLKSLVIIEPASLPETAEYPRRLYNLLTLLIGSALLYGVIRLVLATVREHQD